MQLLNKISELISECKFMNKFLLTLFVRGRGRLHPTPYPSVNFLYHINLNNLINQIFNDFKFYKFINILAKFGCSSPGQLEARTFLSKNFSKFFVLWSFKIFLSFNFLYLGLYYLKVLCIQFFHYLFQNWLFHLKMRLNFNNFYSAK